MGEQTERGAKDKLYRNKCLHESVRVTTCVMKSGFSSVRTINNVHMLCREMFHVSVSLVENVSS